MRKLEIADPEVMRIAIQQEIARSDESRYDHRLHGLLLVAGGQSCHYSRSHKQVKNWTTSGVTASLSGATS